MFGNPEATGCYHSDAPVLKQWMAPFSTRGSLTMAELCGGFEITPTGLMGRLGLATQVRRQRCQGGDLQSLARRLSVGAEAARLVMQ